MMRSGSGSRRVGEGTVGTCALDSELARYTWMNEEARISVGTIGE